MADDPRKAEHEARVKALNEANAESAKAQAMPPTPSQEENDLMALGLMHIDEKTSHAPPQDKDKRPAVTRSPDAAADARRPPEPAHRS